MAMSWIIGRIDTVQHVLERGFALLVYLTFYAGRSLSWSSRLLWFSFSVVPFCRKRNVS